MRSSLPGLPQTPPQQSDERHARAEARSCSRRRCCLPCARRRRYEPAGEAACADGSSAIAELAARLPRGSVLVSATNGKTTTAAMAASIFEAAGISLVHNQAGANMAGGIASTLLDAAGRSGTIAGELGLFEVDELWLDRLAGQLHPRVVVLGNLFRDQLDRYGELETIAERWAGAVGAGGPAERARLVCNADDPLVADLGRERAQGDHEPADLDRERRAGAPAQDDHEPDDLDANGLKSEASLRKATTDRPKTTPSMPASCTSASMTTRWRLREWRMPPTPSTVVAAGRRTCSTLCTSVISAITTVSRAGSDGPPPPCSPARSCWKVCARRASS